LVGRDREKITGAVAFGSGQARSPRNVSVESLLKGCIVFKLQTHVGRKNGRDNKNAPHIVEATHRARLGKSSAVAVGGVIESGTESHIFDSGAVRTSMKVNEEFLKNKFR